MTRPCIHFPFSFLFPRVIPVPGGALSNVNSKWGFFCRRQQLLELPPSNLMMPR